ncbi:ATP-binding protein [Candidatus Poriferisodalis sp.]|uniref:ATP-binding protein n=1 Tax=Candidatus Poriferisodalis sp. TaxID=3101277 RepID=UPI003B026914
MIAPQGQPSSLTPQGYLPRVADTVMAQALAVAPIVVVEGARGTGKSWTGLRHAHSQVRLDSDPGAPEAALLRPQHVLEGDKPRLVDEWQLAPNLWNVARHTVDASPGPGQFVFAGSAHPPDDRTRHSGAGRVMRVRMRPMSLAESGESTAEISLGSLLDGDDCWCAPSAATIEDVVEAMCRGGWPRHLGMAVPGAQALCSAYLAEVARADIPRLGRTLHRPESVLRLLESLSRNIATAAAATTLSEDIAGDRSPSRAAVASYLEALRRVFVVEDLPAWAVHLRSRARLRRSPKRHFVDPSLAAATLRAGPERLWRDTGYLGQAFESLVVRDLRVYAEANDATVHHYQDSNGHELDAVVTHGDGRWLAVEVKLGSGERLDEAAESLKRACEQIDASKTGDPAKKLVITAGGYGYERTDDITVVPISALGP